MYNLIFRITFALATIVQLSAFGQKAVEFEHKFNEQKMLFAEKIYVHTDKPLYFVNDILWFKAYNLSNVKNGFSSLSKVVYVEILDENNKPQAQTMVNVSEGLASGSLQLSKQLETGAYKLRAYTNLMKNAGADSFFEKELYIINPSRVFNAVSTKKQVYDIGFFPEGGAMVEGITGKVAFKALDNSGRGVAVRGVVIDDKNDTVATIKTFKFGIGKFTFAPKPERKYKAICIMPDKEILIKELPEIKKKGYALTFDDKDQLKASIVTNMNESNLYVVVHNGKSVMYAKSSRLVDGRTEVVLDKSALSGGLYHLTVFDMDGNPVAERMFFRKGKDKISFNTDLAKANYTKREKVDLKITAVNAQTKLQSANASFSIYKIDSLQTGQDIDIVSDLYLRLELKGAIENPAYYFSSDNNEVTEALDNLLLTQGWRKFDAKKRGNQPALSFIPEYNGHLISGKVLSPDKNPVKGLSLYLSSPKKKGAFYVTTTDSLGTFLFNTDKLFGKSELIIQADYTKDSTSNISIFSPYYEEYNPIAKQSSTYSDLFKKKKYLEDYYFSSQIQDIYAKKYLNNFYAPDSAQVFYGQVQKSYLLSNYTRFNTLEEVLREYVREVLVFKKKNSLVFNVVGGKESFEENPLVLFDGIPYFDINKIASVYPDDIESIDIFKDRFFYSGETYPGVLSFNSKKATLSDYELNPKAIIIDYEGMQLQREFYAPKYDKATKNHIPDYRSTLHWEPNLLFNGKDKISLSFYTSDVEGRYIGVIQGVSTDGTPGFNTFEIEVKK